MSPTILPIRANDFAHGMPEHHMTMNAASKVAKDARLFDPAAAGRRMYEHVERLYPICRSITGNGVRDSLNILSERIPLVIHEIPSGTQVFDWTIPLEWNIRGAWIKDSRGISIVDFSNSTLHVVSYSRPIHQSMSLADLRPHLHSIPDQPDKIPYRTSYYHEDWGFCLPHRALLSLQDDRYEVLIDSSLTNGSLTYGEVLLPGTCTDEILLTSHICHPALCNDNLSGISVLCELAAALATRPRRHSIRMLFIPGTIGAIAWLALNREVVPRIRHGLVLTCLGDSGPFHYKRSRIGDAAIDRAAQNALHDHSAGFHTIAFSPDGYDERQFCSPGFNLPVGRLSRAVHGRFPEYHNSGDDLSLVSADALAASLRAVMDILYILDNDESYVSSSPFGEPQLGRRGLYRAIGGTSDQHIEELALLWVLNLSDGRHSLLEISDRSGLPFPSIHAAARILETHSLLDRSRPSFPQAPMNDLKTHVSS